MLILALILGRLNHLGFAEQEALAMAAVFHDSRRQDDWLDVGHRQRTADYYGSYCKEAGMACDARTYYHGIPSLIATKTSRIVRAVRGQLVSDFGARRAHNIDAAVYGARAAYIGGASGTATVMAGQEFGIPVNGTMTHPIVVESERSIPPRRSLYHKPDKHGTSPNEPRLKIIP